MSILLFTLAEYSWEQLYEVVWQGYEIGTQSWNAETARDTETAQYKRPTDTQVSCLKYWKLGTKSR